LAKFLFLAGEETFKSTDSFRQPAFLQVDCPIGADFMTAHAIDAEGIIKRGSFFAPADASGGAALHTDIAIGAISILNVRSDPDEGSDQIKQKIGNQFYEPIGGKDELRKGEVI